MRLSFIRFASTARRQLCVVGCANDLAGRISGSSRAPATLMESAFLQNSGIDHRWERVIEQPATSTNQSSERLFESVYKYCKTLAQTVENVIKNDEELLVVGGDHSCAMGTWSGVATATRDRGFLGLVWVDAHMDSHLPSTSGTGNIHGMPLAHLLGHGDKRLSALLDARPKIRPENLALVGVRSFEKEERQFLENNKVRVFYEDEVKRRGVQAVMREAVEIACDGTCGFGMSVDLDVFCARDAPAVAVPEGDLSAIEFLDAIASIDLQRLLALEIVEFLPKFDDAQKTTEKLAVAIVIEVFANKWKQLEEKLAGTKVPAQNP